MRIAKVMREGERIPAGYGYAWTRIAEMSHVCYPIPLNLGLGGLYRVWVWCLRGRMTPEGRAYQAGVEQGLTAGRALSVAERDQTVGELRAQLATEKAGALEFARQLREVLRGDE